MTDPFLGEIQIFGFTFAPYQWAMANGATISIQQQTALFSLLGTYYGGNGTTNFQLPNLAHRVPCSQGQGQGLSDRVIGETFGEDAVGLVVNQLPAHNHPVTAYAGRGVTTKVGTPSTGYLLGTPTAPLSQVTGAAPNTTLAPNAVSVTGGSVPHDNRQPVLGLTFAIAMAGVYPSFS